MLTYALACLVLIHALIHLLGFVKAYGFVPVTRLRTGITKRMGLLWLSAAVLLIGAAAAIALKSPWWWVVAIIGTAVSQWLIITSWRDAKFGTVVNIVIMFMAVAAYGAWNFSSTVNGELQEFLQRRDATKKIVTRDLMAGYPPVVQRWLERSGVVGKEAIRTVRLEQFGMMRTSQTGKWMPFDAAQWFTTGRPGFFWTADVTAMPGVHMVARDRYADGRGSMVIKALSLIPIADAHGAEIDQGSMVRYLAELVWFPSAALESYLHWDEVDATTARVTMTNGGVTASAVLTFTELGDVRSFQAKRYYDRKGGATLEDWYIEMDPDGYAEFNGVWIPARSTVTWKLHDGDLTWLKLEIMNVKYNLL